MAENTRDFAALLTRWQHTHGRHDLPWQRKENRPRDAYRIWLSEIMLQQTQVATVIPYYQRFLERFPDLPSLAQAPTEAVMALWSGLGYYARARNLQAAAQRIVADFNGEFPRDTETIATLPGIGRSTAAAIAVFAFDARAAILDGNVKRVLSRCFGIEGWYGEKAVENRLWALAESLLPERDEHENVIAYTQGLMDLGATVCTRSKPICAACPVASLCIARREDRTTTLPTPRPKRAQPHKAVSMLVLRQRNRVLLERRPPSGIWGGLYSLPELPEPQLDATVFASQTLGCELEKNAGIKTLPVVHHAFTHFRLTITPLLVEVAKQQPAAHETGLVWVDLQELDSAPLPTPIRKILSALG